MSVAMLAPGRAMLLAPGETALWRALRSSGGGGTPTPPATGLAAIAGLSGWWDAGTLANYIETSGASAPAWLGTFASLADLSGGGRALAPFSVAGQAAAVGQPRVSGLLGGAGQNTGCAGLYQPSLHADLGFQVPSVAFGANAAWTRLIVWSRPNLRQNSGRDAQPLTLLASGGTPILQADSAAPGALRVFGTTITTTLARRHTHAVLLRHLPGVGLDVWLDGARVATGMANPLGAAAPAQMLLLHDGTANGGAQCWLNEVATWERALSDADVATALAYLARWALGARRGVSLLVNGQSNAAYWVAVDGAAQLLVQGIAWHLGALAWNLVAGPNNATIWPSHGLYPGPFPGAFLNNTGSDPSVWPLGADGTADQAYIAAQTPADLADVGGILWPWSESDSARAYAEGPTYAAAVRRFLSLERAMVPSGTIADLPHLWWNAIPFGSGTDGGTQMLRETLAGLVADHQQNTICVLPMTADINPRGGTDGNHVDAPDNIRMARLAAPVAARALLAAGRGDSIATFPPVIPRAGGPVIAHAYRESATSVLLTIAHDTGSDLRLPGTAAQGTGFAVMDGGTPAAPTPPVAAVACARVDATHLRLTLARALTNPSPSCLLFYPYGGARLYRGNAVTDNASSVAKPAGWDIAADLGSAWALDCPLAATTLPIPLSDTP